MKTKGFRGLALVAIPGAIPTQLLAQTCEINRPNWTSVDGPVTAWEEAVYVFSSPFGVVILGVVALAILTRRDVWLLAGFVGGAAAGILMYLVSTSGDYAYDTRLIEFDGCAGPNTIVMAICAGICLICMGIFAAKRRLQG